MGTLGHRRSSSLWDLGPDSVSCLPVQPCHWSTCSILVGEGQSESQERYVKIYFTYLAWLSMGLQLFCWHQSEKWTNIGRERGNRIWHAQLPLKSSPSCLRTTFLVPWPKLPMNHPFATLPGLGGSGKCKEFLAISTDTFIVCDIYAIMGPLTIYYHKWPIGLGNRRFYLLQWWVILAVSKYMYNSKWRVQESIGGVSSVYQSTSIARWKD